MRLLVSDIQGKILVKARHGALENFEQNFSKSRINAKMARSTNEERVSFAARPIRIE